MHAHIARLVLIAGMLAIWPMPNRALPLVGAAPPGAPTSQPPRASHAAPASPIPNTFGWQDELVDKLGDLGYASSLALDSSGYPHIAYYDFTAHSLKYAAWDGVAWTLDTVENGLGPIDYVAPRYPIRSAIAVYGTTAYIAYEKIDDVTGLRHLQYAVGRPGGWNISTIAPANNFFYVYAPTLRLDQNHNVHVSYSQYERNLQFAPQSVIYARLGVTSTAWVTQTVETLFVGIDVGLVTSLALDPNNQPQIAYASAYDLRPSRLTLARWNAGNWLTQRVDLTATWPSLAVDSASSPHIAYVDATDILSQKLKYAAWTGVTWTVASLAANIDSYPSLALDVLNRPRIAVFAGSKLAFLQRDGATWQTTNISDAADLPFEPALALDAAGNAHISYFDYHYQDLHAVTWAPNWQTQTVTTSGSGPSLAVDIHNLPFVSYNDSSFTVHLANWTPGGYWHYRTVTPNAFYDSLRLQYDVNRQPLPIVSYADVADLLYPHLGYAQWNGAAFVTQTVDSANGVGAWSSLAFNNSASPIIGYYDAANQRLKLAASNGPSGASWTISTDMAGPLVYNPWLAAGGSPVGPQLYIAYVDSSSFTLRLATWDGGMWTDELVDGGGGDHIVLVSLAVDRTTGDPALAYFDLTHGIVKYAFRSGGSWTKVPVDSSPGNVSDLSLTLALYSNQFPRIAYSASADNSVRLAWTTAPTSTWTVETVGSFGNVSAANLSSAAQTRDYIAVGQSAQTVVYAFRSATLPYSIYFNPLQPCDLLQANYANVGPTLARVRALAPADLEQVDDLTTLRALRDLFALSPGGRYYINLYYQHAHEAGGLALRDPALLWDAYRTLENWLPGFLALAVGQGYSQVITQAMIDQVNNIGDRLVAGGSPALGAAINLERGKYNHLQAFVGLTFDQGAKLLGVSSHAVYMPLVRR